MVKRIAQERRLSQKEAGEAFEATLAEIKEALRAGEQVRLVGFGSFSVKQTAARAGVNPRNRERIKIPAKDRVCFSPGSEMAKAVLKS